MWDTRGFLPCVGNKWKVGKVSSGWCVTLGKQLPYFDKTTKTFMFVFFVISTLKVYLCLLWTHTNTGTSNSWPTSNIGDQEVLLVCEIVDTMMENNVIYTLLPLVLPFKI